MNQETVVAVGFVACALLAAFTAVAQPAPPQVEAARERPLPSDRPNAENAPAPDWLAWRAFHDSLQFYQRRSSDLVLDFIEQAAGLKGDEADALLVAGQEYLLELSRIDDEARAEIRARYQPDAAPRFAPPDPSLLPGPMPSILISAHARDGRKLYDVLLADGFIAQVEQRRQAAFRKHSERLKLTLGAEKLAKLEDRVRTDVAPRITTGASPNLLPPRRANSGLNNYAPARR